VPSAQPDTAMLYDVAIVGCGPVGALAANLLGQAGLSVVILERELELHPLPRAVHLDHEMMRLFQWAGVIDAVLPGMRETQGHLHVGADGGVIRYMGTAGRPKPFGWANDYFFYQPELEEWLRDGFSRFPNVTLRLGCGVEAIDQTADVVTIGTTQGGERQAVRARYVIACDGARSSIRKLLGVQLEDLEFEEPWLVVDAEVDGPIRFPKLTGVPEAADLQQLSVMMCDPTRPATIVPGRGTIRRWEFMLLPGESEEAMMEPDAVARLLAPYLEGVPHRVLRATTYRFHGLIADRWRDGRVFLAGDAAHQTPPFFGQGMCHGMRDVANLAWKLPLVVSGVADARVLDSYQPERDPHVRSVVTSAVAAGQYICELDPLRAAERDAKMRAQEAADRLETAADLIPPYRAGIVANRTPGAGERFVQPWVTTVSGLALLDDVTGGGWRLFVREGGTGAALAPVPLTVVAIGDVHDDGTLTRWFDKRGVDAVLVRPDSYVFGTAKRDGLDALLGLARETLGLRHAAELAA
jgi:3-(3-hydroxy-phenyl)propionate hydroxylase